MKAFTYIDENNKEVLDLIHLFEHAFDYKLDTKDIILAIAELQKHVKIQTYDEQNKVSVEELISYLSSKIDEHSINTQYDEGVRRGIAIAIVNIRKLKQRR